MSQLCEWCLCNSAAGSACDAEWVVLTKRTLTMILMGLRSACQVHLTCV